MTKEEMIRDLERRIENCKKRIAEVKGCPDYTYLNGELTTLGKKLVYKWECKMNEYKILLRYEQENR